MPVSREKFFLGHSLATNKLPAKASVKGFSRIKEREVDLESLGLFDTSSPNFNTYYPDLKPEDLVPKDEEFAYPVFRALSEIIINKYGPIDFAQEGVLKASVKKLIGQSVFTNHEAIVGNEVGVIMEAAWDKTKMQGKFNIPAGINVKLKLDGKSNPKLVRGIQSSPPSIHSVSVTVAFKWEKSHPELSDEEFWNKVGNYDKENQLIRRVVTEVFSYEEISLVTHGADPYAQKINEDGDLNNPAYADNRYQFTAEDFASMEHYFDWKDFTGKVRLDNKGTIPSSIKLSKTKIKNNSTKQDVPMNEALLKLLRAQLGLAATVSEADVIAKLSERLPVLVASETTNATLTADLATANSNLTASKAKEKTDEEVTLLAAAPGYKDVAEKATTALKAEALKLYHLTVGGADKADPSITKMLADASYDTATALFKQYSGVVEKDFAATCEDCGSKKVSRASASAGAPGVQLPGGGTGGSSSTPKEIATADVLAQFNKPKSLTHGIHGETIK
jgi:hypothetical protein